MSDSDLHKDGADRAASVSPRSAAPSARKTGVDHVKALWAEWAVRVWHSVRSGRGRSAGGFLRRNLLLIVLICLFVFPLAGLLLGYILRPSPGTPEEPVAGVITNTPEPGSGEKIAKPPAGKPLLGTMQGPPPSVTSPAPPPSITPAPPPPIEVPQRPLSSSGGVPASPTNPATIPPPQAASPASAYTPMVYPARHDKLFGQGCAGQLTLDTNGLAFRCPDDPSNSVQIALADIESVDGNGVRLVSGKKYHFSIAGMGKSNAEQLFANWLSRVR